MLIDRMHSVYKPVNLCNRVALIPHMRRSMSTERLAERTPEDNIWFRKN
jgi:hypothetical protein